MKHLTKIIYCSLFLLLVSCNFKPCERVTDRDVVGYYIPIDSRNNGRQFIQILDNHTFMMMYCVGDSIVVEWGTWIRHSGCRVSLDGIRWLNSPFEEEVIGSRTSGAFGWRFGRLVTGVHEKNFQKVRRRPRLVCESCNRRR